MQNLYQACTPDARLSAPGDALRKLIDRVKKAYQTAAKHLHDTRQFAYTDKPVKALHKALTHTLQNAVDTAITHEVPEAMLQKLKQDVFVFSGMKTYAQLKELSGLLTDDKGHITPWPQFLHEAQKRGKLHNQHYLQAEYQYALGTSQALDKYLQYAKDGDAYHLQIRTAGDNRVRDSHAALHNITLPFGDPFWNTHWIPFGWRCRCNIVQVLPQDYPTADPHTATALAKKAMPEMFRYNPAKQKIIFPPQHPYYAQYCGKKLHLSASIELARIVLQNERDKCAWQKRLKEDMPDKSALKEFKEQIFKKARADQFDVIHDKNGAKVLKHQAVLPNPNNPNDDYHDRIKTAKAAASEGISIEILPDVSMADKKVRKTLFPNYASETKNPDFRNVGTNEYLDLKRPSAIKNILGNANDASNKQKAIAIIADLRLNKKMEEDVLQNRVDDIFKSKFYKEDVVYFFVNGRFKKYNRP